MSATPGPLGDARHLQKKSQKKDDKLALEGSVSMVDEGEGRGGVNTKCAMYNGIPSKGA